MRPREKRHGYHSRVKTEIEMEMGSGVWRYVTVEARFYRASWTPQTWESPAEGGEIEDVVLTVKKVVEVDNDGNVQSDVPASEYPAIVKTIEEKYQADIDRAIEERGEPEE